MSQQNDIIIKKVKELSREELETIKSFLVTIFSDNPDYKKSVYSNPDLDICVLLYGQGKLVGHAGITKRVVSLLGKDWIVGGVGDVGVDKLFRNHGAGKRLMQSVNNQLISNNFNLGMLFCHPDLGKFYSSCKWKKKKSGKVWSTKNGLSEDQRTSYIFSVTLSEQEEKQWNTQEINVGEGSW